MPAESTTRLYTTRRQNIVDAFVTVIEGINGTGDYQTSVAEVSPRLTFWDGEPEHGVVPNQSEAQG